MLRPVRFALLVLLALLAAGALCPAPARADQREVGFGFYEDKARKILKTAGIKVWEAAKTAKAFNLHQFALEQAERALEFDPDLRDAREHLGYVRKDDKWVLDAEAAGKVLKQNTKNQGESEESVQKRIDKWADESLAPADRFVAAKYAELGDECLAKGYPDQAAKGYEAAIRLDKDNAKARKGLGYKKLGKVWLTDKQEKARKDAAKAEVVAEAGKWDEFFRTKLNKVQSAHFRIESPYTVEELKGYAAAAETAYAYILSDFGMDPTMDVLNGNQLQFVVIQTEDQWNKYVDAFGGSDKEFTRKLAGSGDGSFFYCVASRAGSSATSRTDMVVHTAIHSLSRQLWRITSDNAGWIYEGLAYYYSIKVLENTLTHCVGQKEKPAYGNQGGGGVEGGIKKWDDAAGWKPAMKAIVKKKNDTDLRALMTKPMHLLGFEDTVKSWGMVTYLMEKDREKFLALMSGLAGTKTKPDILMQNTYENGIEAIDEEWRKHVLKTY